MLFLGFFLVFGHLTAISLSTTLMAACMPVLITGEQGSGPSPGALEHSGALNMEKDARTPVQQKISSQLLYELELRRGDITSDDVRKKRSRVMVDADGFTMVDIRADVTEMVLTQIEARGGSVISSFPQYQSIRARIHLDQLESLARMPEIKFIRPAEEFITHPRAQSE